MIDKYTGREIVSPADKLMGKASVFNTKPSKGFMASALRQGSLSKVRRNNLMQKILSLKLTASQTEAVIAMLLARQNYLDAVKSALAMQASKAIALLAAVGVEGSELKESEFGLNQIQELRSASQDHIPNSIIRAGDLDR